MTELVIPKTPALIMPPAPRAAPPEDQDRAAETAKVAEQLREANAELMKKFVAYDSGRRRAFLEGANFAEMGIQQAACNLSAAGMYGAAEAFGKLADTIGKACEALGTITSKAKLVKHAKRRRRG